jgi:uncharacterized protein (DUF3084 family)
MEHEPRHEQPEKPGRTRAKRRRARARTGAAPDGTPVVRLDIYASSEGRGARQVLASPGAAPGHGPEQAELDRRKLELDQLARSLAEQREQTSISERRLKSSIAELDARERRLAEREAELEQAHAAEVDAADIERRRRRLAGQEETLNERTHELRRLEQQVEERERKLAEREAQVLVELDFKEDELEGREQALAEHERRLVRKENELTAYVGQIQGRLTVSRST